MAPSAIAGAHGIAGTSERATLATATVVSPTAQTTSPVTGSPVVFEVSKRRIVGRVEQYRRDEERQREFGCESERRRSWNKCE